MTDVFLHIWLNSRISSYILVYFCITYVIPSGHVQHKQLIIRAIYVTHYLWFFWKTMSEWRTALSQNPGPDSIHVRSTLGHSWTLWGIIKLRIFTVVVYVDFCASFPRFHRRRNLCTTTYPYFWDVSDKFLGKKFYNSLKTGPTFFLQHFKNKITYNFVKFVARKRYGNKFFFHPSLLLLFLDPGSEIRDG